MLGSSQNILNTANALNDQNKLHETFNDLLWL